MGHIGLGGEAPYTEGLISRVLFIHPSTDPRIIVASQYLLKLHCLGVLPAVPGLLEVQRRSLQPSHHRADGVAQPNQKAHVHVQPQKQLLQEKTLIPGRRQR